MKAIPTKPTNETMRRMNEALKKAVEMPHRPHKGDKSTAKGRVRVGKSRD